MDCGKPPSAKCPNCDFVTYHKGNLRSHIARKHTPENALNQFPQFNQSINLQTEMVPGNFWAPPPMHFPQPIDQDPLDLKEDKKL